MKWPLYFLVLLLFTSCSHHVRFCQDQEFIYRDSLLNIVKPEKAMYKQKLIHYGDYSAHSKKPLKGKCKKTLADEQLPLMHGIYDNFEFKSKRQVYDNGKLLFEIEIFNLNSMKFHDYVIRGDSSSYFMTYHMSIEETRPSRIQITYVGKHYFYRDGFGSERIKKGKSRSWVTGKPVLVDLNFHRETEIKEFLETHSQKENSLLNAIYDYYREMNQIKLEHQEKKRLKQEKKKAKKKQ